MELSHHNVPFSITPVSGGYVAHWFDLLGDSRSTGVHPTAFEARCVVKQAIAAHVRSGAAGLSEGAPVKSYTTSPQRVARGAEIAHRLAQEANQRNVDIQAAYREMHRTGNRRHA